MSANLTEHERSLIDRAREVGPALRASTGDRDRLAGWLLAELADLAERLGGEPELCWCGHLERVHNTVGHSGGRGFCTECAPSRCGRYEQAKERHLGS